MISLVLWATADFSIFPWRQKIISQDEILTDFLMADSQTLTPAEINQLIRTNLYP